MLGKCPGGRRQLGREAGVGCPRRLERAPSQGSVLHTLLMLLCHFSERPPPHCIAWASCSANPNPFLCLGHVRSQAGLVRPPCFPYCFLPSHSTCSFTFYKTTCSITFPCVR